ncbi:MAG: hypothetical protein ACRD88_02895 [Terriglobia bacterium]
MPTRRELLAEKLLDVANIAVAALIFGQFVSGQPFHIGVAAFGVGFWSLIYGAVYFYFLKERE